MPKMFSTSTMFLEFFFANENMKKPAQIQPKSQFLFHKIYNDFGCNGSAIRRVNSTKLRFDFQSHKVLENWVSGKLNFSFVSHYILINKNEKKCIFVFQIFTK